MTITCNIQWQEHSHGVSIKIIEGMPVLMGVWRAAYPKVKTRAHNV